MNLTKSQVNLLAKLEKDYGITPGTEKDIRVNPYTGVKRNLEPLAVALYDFIIETYRSTQGWGEMSYRGKKVNVQTWDRSRHLFLAIWPDEYCSLLD